jgi:hypothetical protein
MIARNLKLLKRCAAALLLTAGLGGCAVYGPPYAGYDPYYGGSGYSTYVGPPVELNLGLGYYGGARHGYDDRYHRGYHGSYHRGYHGGYHRGHGWRDGRGYRGGRGWHRGRGRGGH